jgi:putative membrane protein
VWRPDTVWTALIGFIMGDAETESVATRWRPDSLGMAVLSVLIFTFIGIVASLAGFKLWDRFTPGNLEEEICRKQNIAAAILGAAIVLGVSIIVAAAMIG